MQLRLGDKANPGSISAQEAGEVLSERSRAGIFPRLRLKPAGIQGSPLRVNLLQGNLCSSATHVMYNRSNTEVNSTHTVFCSSNPS